MQKLPSVDKIFIFPFDKPLEREFDEHIKPLMITSMTILSLVYFLTNFCFAWIDGFRLQSNAVILYRLVCGLIILVFYFIFRQKSWQKYPYNYYMVIICYFVVIGLAFGQDYYFKMPIFFLSNSLSTLVFLFAVLSNLKTKDILWVNLLLILFFILYTQSEANLSKIVYAYNILLNGLLGVLMTYLLERNQRIIFIKQKTIEAKTLEIQLKNESLAKMNETKDNLFALLAHDLKSPLNSLNGLIDLLLTERLDNQDFKRHLQNLYQKSNETAQFLDNLLLWIQLQFANEDIQPDQQTIELNQLLTESQQILADVLQKKDLKIIELNQISAYISVDYEMIKTDIRNLLNNAIKFSPIGESITIEIIEKDKFWQLNIQNQGQIIPLEIQNQLFNQTVAPSIGTFNEKGTGLGLHLCQAFVKKNQGSIGFTSEEGKGTTFWVCLPKAKPDKEEI